jgi:hypothetical protein
VAPELTGCARSEAYRYKLTLEVDTPQGIRTAYNVVEVTTTAVGIPARGEYPRVKGQALYLDINGKPLIALLDKFKYSFQPPQPGQSPSSALGEHPPWADWGYDSPTDLLDWLYSPQQRHISRLDAISYFGSIREPRELAANQMPSLVTFADVNDPKTVAPVDPTNLEATFGPGVKWRLRTIAITNEKLTGGLTERLPWLKTMMPEDLHLDGDRYRRADAALLFANMLQTSAFIHAESF